MTTASSRDEAADLIEAFATSGGVTCNAITVRNALPHIAGKLVGTDFITALQNLGAKLQFSKVKLQDLTKNDLPCLFMARSMPTALILAAEDGNWRIRTAEEDNPRWISEGSLTGTAVRILPQEYILDGDQQGSIAESFKGFRRIISGLLIASLFTNLAALASPLLVMVIYDQIIPTKSVDTIVSFGIAACVVVILDIALRSIRAMAVAHMGSLVERELGLSLFKKLSHLPLSNLEKSGVHEQIARLRQFESFRDIFSGSLFTTFLDLPFALIFIAVLFFLSLPVGLLLLAFIVVFAIASFVSLMVQRSLSEKSAATRSTEQQLLYEASKNVLSIQRLGAEEFWKERLENASEKAADAARKAKQAQLIAQTFGQSLMMAAGAGTIAFGAASAVSGDTSIGALIALITLVWRVLGPVQTLYSSANQIGGFVTGIHQINRVLSLDSEFVRAASTGPRKKFSGRIDISNISHRFDPTQEPVLSGVSLSINPGEVTVFCGLSGSGRSTLFNLINRLHTPTSGAIYFDGVDYRQIAAGDLRQAVTMENQYSDFFHGSIRQNFELANPVVTSDEIWVVLGALGLSNYINDLPDGIETRMDEAFQNRMSRSIGKGLGLARCLLRDSNIYLLNQPGSGLDATHEHRFLTCLNELRGARTVLMTSDRPSHWELADNIVFLDRGKVVINEPRATALPKIKALYRQVEARQ